MIELNFVFSKFINLLMKSGKKSKAEKVLTNICLFLIKKKNPLIIFIKALSNTVPTVEIKNIRRGSRQFEIPKFLSSNRGISQIYRLLINEASTKSGLFVENFANILIDYSEKKGKLVISKNNLEKRSKKLRGLSHYRW